LIEHRDAFELDNGAVKLSFYAPRRLSGTLFSKDHVQFGEGGHLTMRLHRGRVEVRLQSTDRSYVIRSEPIQSSVWYDVEFRFGNAGMQLLIDGIEVASDPYSGGLGQSSGGTGNVEDIAIGASKIRSNPDRNDRLNYDFTGRIKDVQIVDGSGQLVFSEASTPYEVDWTNNFFDGDDDYFELEHDAQFELDSGAIELTFNANQVDQTQGLFSKDNRGFDQGGHLTVRIVNERVEVRLQNASSSFTVRSQPIVAGVDYELRFEFGDQGMNLWLDGNLVDRRDFNGGIADNTNSIILGANQWGSDESGDRLQDYFDGMLGDFRIVDGSGTEIDLVF
ncbi:MAG: LamG-like jellyroll fold domain-containing protein, partial [Planctomycetota bacterium]